MRVDPDSLHVPGSHGWTPICGPARGNFEWCERRRLTPSDSATRLTPALEGTPDYLAQIVAQRAIADSARAELERRIVAARDAGVPLRRIAEAADMSHEYVRKLNPTERGNT